MTALAPLPTADHAAPAAPRPARLREVSTALPRRPRTPAAGDVARYGLGLTLGFLLAAVASGAGGTLIVGGQLALAGVAALITAGAALRARAVAGR